MYIPMPQSPEIIYHYTKKKNLDSILRDGVIKRFDDTECWFSLSIYDMVILMQYTVMREGRPFIAVGGKVSYYPKFDPEDYVILKLQPLHSSKTKWFHWKDPITPKLPKDRLEAIERAKVCYRGNLRFKEPATILEMSEVLNLIHRGEPLDD